MIDQQFNIFLICIDDLRADRLSFMGNERETCPNLSRRRESAITFTNCHSPVGWTLPGCASIITGLEPDIHGMVNHSNRFRVPKLGHYVSEDFHRVAITNNGNLVSDEINQAILDGLGMERKPKNWRRFGWNEGFDEYWWWSREYEIAPYEKAQKFLRSVKTSSDIPWFLFFHSNLVHDYHMDRGCYFDAAWSTDSIPSGLRSVPDGPGMWRNLQAGLSVNEAKRHMLDKYDAGILAMDGLLERLFCEVNFDTTIVVFTSDHGEGFEPELGRVHHCGRLHNDLTHVPLLFWLPPDLRVRHPVENVETGFCSTVDIVPTLLKMMGQELPRLSGRLLTRLPKHRVLKGSDRGYLFWDVDCVRESYEESDVESSSELCYPMKRIQVRRDGKIREFEYNLAYDPGEIENLLEDYRSDTFQLEPTTFIVAVNDYQELRWNLLSSPIAEDSAHQWIVVDNRNNARYGGVSELYSDGLEKADNDLVFFLHQDVYLPRGWDSQVQKALEELQQVDPDWGVIGAVGMIPEGKETMPGVAGHWCDPHGYHRCDYLPRQVQSLDELWLGMRKSRGLSFDPRLPGFHCYGIDLCLSARDRDLKSYAVDAFLWHKYRNRDGKLVESAESCEKLRYRWSEAFMSDFQPSQDYVGRKWRKFCPFRSTSWYWQRST